MVSLILLVDDEDTTRETTATMLRAMGFEVLLAVDGLAGVEAFEQHAHRLRLVILDLTMPRMDGKEAYPVIRHMNAHIPVLLSSGYSEQERSKEFYDKEKLGFLQKPYTFRELKAALQTRLG